MSQEEAQDQVVIEMPKFRLNDQSQRNLKGFPTIEMSTPP